MLRRVTLTPGKANHEAERVLLSCHNQHHDQASQQIYPNPKYYYSQLPGIRGAVMVSSSIAQQRMAESRASSFPFRQCLPKLFLIPVLE
jgi:hypothetical protein